MQENGAKKSIKITSSLAYVKKNVVPLQRDLKL